MDPEQAIQRLREGNARFAAGSTVGPGRDAERRRALASGQAPWAMVVTCADSRVVPELLFDVGLGDLFVVRVAGNVAMPAVVGSLELAVSGLGCRLLLVLGHEGCGAVQATLAEKGAHQGAIPELTRRVAESVPDLDPAAADAPLETVYANVRRQVDILRTCPPILAPAVADGQLRVVGAVYRLASGTVDFLSEAPGVSRDLTAVARGLTAVPRRGPRPVPRPPRKRQ